MSGIAGIIRFDGAPVEPELIKKMTTAMSHRGPDGIFHWVKGTVALGHCMLRTTPESLEETQPWSNEDKSLVLVMDGRVDNWEELRQELLGNKVRLRNRSDAELVLRAYELWGEDCLPHIDGDFALVIWDNQKQKAFCARDRVGNKPFHYHWNGKALVFASELHPIMLTPWIAEIPNEGMIAEFLAADWYSRDETLWVGIMRLVAAHQMTVDATGQHLKQYWIPDLWATFPYKNDQDYIDHYRELLIDVTRRLSRSHRPVAYEVSGGLDSSAIFCIAEYLRRANNLPAPAIDGYTLDFQGDKNADEMKYARAVGEYLKLHIHEIPPSLFLLSWFIKKSHNDKMFPGYPNGLMSTGLLKRVSQQGTVLLTGIGGDEWLEGSRVYYAEELQQRHWDKFYECFKTDVEMFGKLQTARWIIRYGLFPLLPIQLQNTIRHYFRVIRGRQNMEDYWLSPKMQKEIDKRRCFHGKPPQQNKVAYFGQQQLVEMLYSAFDDHAMVMTDTIGSNMKVEFRHPLRSYKIIEYALLLPERLRLHGNRTKYVHTRALQDIMPLYIINRHDKAEFSTTFRDQLDNMSNFFEQDLPTRRLDWLLSDGISRLYGFYKNNPKAGKPMWVLWSILGCDSSLREHL